MDVVKSLAQSGQASGSMLNTSREIMKNQGVKGFYGAGYGPAVMRAFPANGGLFLGVELSLRFYDWVYT